MPETKPREPEEPSPSSASATGSSNGDSTPPEGSIEQVAKRRRFEQWVASVRPKAPPAKPSVKSNPSASSPHASAASVDTTPPQADDVDASPEISVSSNPPPLMSTSPPPAGHSISSPPPSFLPHAQQHESDSTQLYQMVPADILRKAREMQALSEPPAAPETKRKMPSADSLREDPWATADERTAVFAPPPELLASVRAAAASAGLIPKDEVAGETSPPSGRITAEFDVQAPDSPAASVTAAKPQVTRAAVAAEPRATAISSPPPAAFATEQWQEPVPARPRWPWAVAVLLIAASLGVLALRSQRAPAPPRPTNVVAPAR